DLDVTRPPQDDLRVPTTELKTQAVAVAFSIAWLQGEVEPQPDGARGWLAVFRRELHRCFTARADELFELADAVLCADGPVRGLAGLALVAAHRRAHGAVYGAVNRGGVANARPPRSPPGLPLRPAA